MFDWLSNPKAVNPNEDRHADVILKPYTHTSIESLSEVHFSPSQMVALTSLLKALPPTIQTIPLLRGAYILSFTPEIASKISTGAATLMQATTHNGLRAIAVSTEGRILGHGTLVAAQGLQLATAVVGIWQVLAIVTAQHYLPDIQQRLTCIETNVQELRQWMEADEKAILIASLKSLQQFADVVLGQPLREDKTTFWCQHIEYLYFASHQISEASQLKVQTQVEHLAKMNTTDWFNVDQNYRQLVQMIDKIDGLVKTLLSALVVQVIAINCLVNLNHYPEIQKQRLRDIPDVLAKLMKTGETIIWILTKKSEVLGGPIDPWGNDRAKRHNVMAHLQHTLKDAHDQILEVIRLTDQSHNYLEQQSLFSTMGISLVIDADTSGEIIRVSQLNISYNHQKV